MKKILSICLLLVCMTALFACTDVKGDFGGEPVDLMPNYIGGAIDDPNHVFTKDEFTVTLIFSDSSTREITDYTLRQERAEGCFEIFVTWKDIEGYRIIPIGYEPAAETTSAESETVPETEQSAE